MSLLPTRIADISVHVVQIPRHYVTHIAEGSPPGGKETSLYYVLQIISDDGQVGLGEISDIEPDWAPPHEIPSANGCLTASWARL